MRAVFNHSWNLLNERERVLFSRLAVFRGNWTLTAAINVAGATPHMLTALVDKSLVVMQATTLDVPGPRFTLLVPIREYALEQLVARGEVAALQRAHATYYLALAEAVAAQAKAAADRARAAQESAAADAAEKRKRANDAKAVRDKADSDEKAAAARAAARRSRGAS